MPSFDTAVTAFIDGMCIISPVCNRSRTFLCSINSILDGSMPISTSSFVCLCGDFRPSFRRHETYLFKQILPSRVSTPLTKHNGRESREGGAVSMEKAP
jgi:hypothetical protein